MSSTTQHQRPAADSFYHLNTETFQDRACQGLACFVARHRDADRWERACTQTARVYCLGQCYQSPAVSTDTRRPHIAVHSKQTVLLERIINGPVRTLAAYRQADGYAALEKVRSEKPEAILGLVEASNLRGRGGAGFPAGRKWRAVASQPPGQKYVVANADEGDPGAYIDRFLIEDDPHCLIEAMAIAGHAVGASRGYIYLRKEYPAAVRVLEAALAEVRAAGILGEAFDLTLFEGHGAYICGEETSLLNSIEGERAEVRSRPPYPTEQGLWGRPTLVNNVETLANIPWLVRNGADKYRTLGFSKSQGTKLVSLNSLFRTPGLYEVEFGVTLRHIVEELGGGLTTGTLKGVVVGGPLAGIVPPTLLDTAFGFEEMRAIGAMVGHGGILAFDEKTSIKELMHHVAAFAAYESCGKCTPCRCGGARLEEMFAAGTGENAESREITAALLATSLCGLGTGLGEFLSTAFKHYAKELQS